MLPFPCSEDPVRFCYTVSSPHFALAYRTNVDDAGHVDTHTQITSHLWQVAKKHKTRTFALQPLASLSKRVAVARLFSTKDDLFAAGM
jgi:hypothetical protein